MDCPWGARELSWAVRGLPMGYRWGVRGEPVGYPWVVRGLPTGSRGMSTGYLPLEIHQKDCPWGCP